jgi:hypothetical protein
MTGKILLARFAPTAVETCGYSAMSPARSSPTDRNFRIDARDQLSPAAHARCGRGAGSSPRRSKRWQTLSRCRVPGVGPRRGRHDHAAGDRGQSPQRPTQHRTTDGRRQGARAPECGAARIGVRHPNGRGAGGRTRPRAGRPKPRGRRPCLRHCPGRDRPRPRPRARRGGDADRTPGDRCVQIDRRPAGRGHGVARALVQADAAPALWPARRGASSARASGLYGKTRWRRRVQRRVAVLQNEAVGTGAGVAAVNRPRPC